MPDDDRPPPGVDSSEAEAGYWQAGLDPSRPEIARARRLLRWVNLLSPRLAGRIALEGFGTVRAHQPPGREERWSVAAERVTVPSPSGPLAGLSWGSGPAVLLAHGWEGRASQMGAIGTALAAAGHRALALDAPGHGESGGKRSSLLAFARSIEAAVEAEGPFVGFVGHSFGIAGAAFAVERGELAWDEIAARLVFVCPAADLHRFIAAVWQAVGLAPRAAAAFVRGLERRIGADWERARRCATLTATDLPLLVLHDHDDRDTPIAEAEEVAAAWPGALRASRGLGHRRILRDAESVAAIVDFLAD